MGEKLGLGSLILLPKQQQQQLKLEKKLLADTLEAYIGTVLIPLKDAGALYIDKGLKTAADFVHLHILNSAGNPNNVLGGFDTTNLGNNGRNFTKVDRFCNTSRRTNDQRIRWIGVHTWGQV